MKDNSIESNLLQKCLWEIGNLQGELSKAGEETSAGSRRRAKLKSKIRNAIFKPCKYCLKIDCECSDADISADVGAK